MRSGMIENIYERERERERFLQKVQVTFLICGQGDFSIQCDQT